MNKNNQPYLTSSSEWIPRFSLPCRSDLDAVEACVVRPGISVAHTSFQPIWVHSQALLYAWSVRSHQSSHEQSADSQSSSLYDKSLSFAHKLLDPVLVIPCTFLYRKCRSHPKKWQGHPILHIGRYLDTGLSSLLTESHHSSIHTNQSLQLLLDPVWSAILLQPIDRLHQYSRYCISEQLQTSVRVERFLGCLTTTSKPFKMTLDKIVHSIFGTVWSIKLSTNYLTEFSRKES